MLILYSNHNSWSVYNFRLEMLLYLQSKGYHICIVSSGGKYLKKLENYGFDIFEINFKNSGKNIFSDIKLLFQYYFLYKKINPDIVLHNAIKPNIYGSIACRLLKIPVINNISGLGSLFISKSTLNFFILYIYRISHAKVNKVFFQNKYDLDLFIRKKIINNNTVELLPGSGVNLNKFHPRNIKTQDDNMINFCFMSRLLVDKGINEYFEAADIIMSKYSNVKFFIMGQLWEDNPSSLNKKVFYDRINKCKVDYLGESDNIDKEIGKFSCIILPSYREGMSRILLEACSTGIPIIATNVPGCKEIIEEGLISLAVFGLIASVIGSFYYIRFVKVMFFDNSEESIKYSFSSSLRLVNLVCIIFIIAFIIIISITPLVEIVKDASLALN